MVISSATENSAKSLIPANQLLTLGRMNQILRKSGLNSASARTILEQLKKSVNIDGASLYVAEDEGRNFKELASLGTPVQSLDFIRSGKTDVLSKLALTKKEPFLLKNRAAAARMDPSDPFATLLILPLIWKDEIVGTLNLGATTPDAINETGVEFCVLVGDLLSVAVRCYRLSLKIEETDKQEKNDQSLVADASEAIASLNTVNQAATIAVDVNHQVNNSLAVIIGNIQCLLLEDIASNQKALSRLRRIEAAALQIGGVNGELIKIHSLFQNIDQIEQNKV